ncbi:transposase [Butyricicoccus sp. 1XD8-22]|nr:transposase [Butyricicoccus sp. 1XD8-22]
MIGEKGTREGNSRDTRQFINGVIWILRTGEPWWDLPEADGNRKNVHRNWNAPQAGAAREGPGAQRTELFDVTGSMKKRTRDNPCPFFSSDIIKRFGQICVVAGDVNTQFAADFFVAWRDESR